jgi:Bacteriocin-protection, YdeI or OmpD-Associated/Domain of unknown function (DUF1905)
MVKLKDPGPIEFDAVLEREPLVSGSACWIDFPYDLKATYGKGNLVPVNALFDGRVPYQGVLAMMGGNCAILLVRTDVREQLGKDKGDTVRVRVELDTKPRTTTLADDTRAALDMNPAAKEFWESLANSHKREYHQWIEEAKKPETRQRRIEQMVEMLAAGKKSRG